jgi:TonB family protein
MYHLLVGRTVGDRYEVRTLLGRGGMGAVYRAHDAMLHRDVALKVIAVQAADPEEEEALRRRFHREARLSARLRHPNVVAIHDFVRDEALRIDGIVMELLEGEDLGQRVARTGPLEREEALEVMSQAARGIAAGHRAGLLHRDVKPPNLFLGPAPGRARVHVHVLDFGIAQEAAPAEGTATHLTAYGRNPLSPRFASPEQWRGGVTLTPASDVFSLAMTGWFALAGEPPYTVEELQEGARSGRLPPLAVPAGWPPALETLFRRALAADPRARFPDGEALEAAIDRVREGNPLPAPDATLLRPFHPPAPAPVRPRPVNVGGRPTRRRPHRLENRARDSLQAWMGAGLILLLAALWLFPRLLDLYDARNDSAPAVIPAAEAPVVTRAAYEAGEVDEPPSLSTAEAAELSREMERQYPAVLRRLRVGGTVHLRLLVLEDGRVDPGSVEVVTATHDAFVDPSIRALSRVRYRPGSRAGVPVRVWVDQPVTWQATAP